MFNPFFGFSLKEFFEIPCIRFFLCWMYSNMNWPSETLNSVTLFFISGSGLVVLIERNYNIYPIKADFVGLSLATTYQQYVKVNLDRRNKAVYLS